MLTVEGQPYMYTKYDWTERKVFDTGQKDVPWQDRKMYHGRTERYTIAGQKDVRWQDRKVYDSRTERCTMAGQNGIP